MVSMSAWQYAQNGPSMGGSSSGVDQSGEDAVKGREQQNTSAAQREGSTAQQMQESGARAAAEGQQEDTALQKLGQTIKQDVSQSEQSDDESGS